MAKTLDRTIELTKRKKEKTMGLTLKEFIKHVLINEIKIIQQTYEHHYLSFGLIAQGIELLGAYLDCNSSIKKHKR